MNIRTENALAFSPGMIFNSLEDGHMVVDRNSGEYVPIDQVLTDPMRTWVDIEDVDEDAADEDKIEALEHDLELEELRAMIPKQKYKNEKEEIEALIAAQEADDNDMIKPVAHCSGGRQKISLLDPNTGVPIDRKGGREHKKCSYRNLGRKPKRDR